MIQTGATPPNYPAAMVPMTAEQQAEVDARLDELMTQIRDLSRRLDAVTAVLPAASA
jgi:uncharacterized protein YceH (UPF0502 family)